MSGELIDFKDKVALSITDWFILQRAEPVDFPNGGCGGFDKELLDNAAIALAASWSENLIQARSSIGYSEIRPGLSDLDCKVTAEWTYGGVWAWSLIVSRTWHRNPAPADVDSVATNGDPDPIVN